MSRDSDHMWRLAGRYSAVALGTLGGVWLDKKLGTTPWLFWFGLAVGVGAAVRAILRVVREFKRTSR